ncbi:acyltransferase family protein [Dictyobacter formicarum]|uniref:Acyltransferase n=1 Tax=Dictyobacter formicarum TaxID=2778368 RepID=A0ABQ3VJX0_9CHLR|nr:acyltransferase [Dictyobacter formicarum]GHO85668.1 acyltransferase [Dictyobacter formicarum]
MLDAKFDKDIAGLETIKTPASHISDLETMKAPTAGIAGKTSVPQTKAQSSSPRFEGLEAYRGITALIIICYHCYQHAEQVGVQLYAGTMLQMVLTNSDDVVSLFFVLSGFLNFLPFARAALKQQGAYPLGGFVIRRAIRIIPVYYIAFLITWATRYYGSPQQWLDLLEHLTFTQIFDSRHIFWTLGPTWSLAVEFWFYFMLVMLAPLSYYLCSRCKTHKGKAIMLYAIPTFLLVVGVGYKIYCLVVLHIPIDNYAVYFSLPGRLDNFSMGMGLAVLMATNNNHIKVRKYVPWLLRGVAFLLIVLSWINREISVDEISEYIFYHSMWSIAMLLVIAAAVLGSSNFKKNKNAVSQRVWVYLSLISYSIFLWHEPLLIGLDRYLIFTSGPLFPVSVLTLILLALGVASLSYWLLEYPIGFLGHLFTKEGKLRTRYID